jgi:hypothetical protein
MPLVCNPVINLTTPITGPIIGCSGSGGDGSGADTGNDVVFGGLRVAFSGSQVTYAEPLE